MAKNLDSCIYCTNGVIMSSEAQKKAELKYKKNHLKRIPLDIQLSDYTILKSFLDANQLSTNSFIKSLIKEELKKHDIDIF